MQVSDRQNTFSPVTKYFYELIDDANCQHWINQITEYEQDFLEGRPFPCQYGDKIKCKFGFLINTRSINCVNICCVVFLHLFHKDYIQTFLINNLGNKCMASLFRS